MFELFRMMGTIGINNSEANSAMADTETQADQTSKSIGQSLMDGLTVAEEAIGKAGTTMSKWVTGPIVAAGTGIMGLMTKTGNYADSILDLSDITGLSTDALQEWEYIAGIAGVSGDAVAQSARRMIQRLDGLTQETEENTKMFEEMGLSHQAWMDLDQEGKVESVIYALAEMEDETRRNEIANEMFGRGWMDLAPILGMGAEELEKLGIEAHEVGAVMDGESLEAANNFRVEMERLKAEFMGIFYEVSGHFIPIFENVFLPLIQNHIMPAVADFAERIGELAEWFVNLDEELQNNILQWVGIAAAIGPVLLVISKVIGAIKGIVAIFTVKAAAMSAIVIGIAALVGAIVWLYQNNETAREIIDAVWSFIRDFVTTVVSEVTSFVMDLWGKLTSWWSENNEQILEAAQRVWQFISDHIERVMLFLVPLIQGSWEQIQTIIDTAMNIILGIIEAITSLIVGDFEGFKAAIEGITDSMMNFVRESIDNGLNTVFGIFENVLGLTEGTVRDRFNSIRDTITDTINSARDAVQTAVDAIRGFMDFSWELPMPRLPRFSLEGSMNPLNWPPVPRIGVEWYADGGIMERATAFGMNGNNVMVGGEAGREAILPLNAENLAGIGKGIAEASGFNTEYIVRLLQQILSEMREVANRPIVVDVQVDGKTIARVTRDPMDNQLGRKQHDRNQAKGRRR